MSIFNIGYDDSPSIFESQLTANVGAGGIDVTVTTDQGSGSQAYSPGMVPAAPRGGIGIVSLILIGLLAYIALK